MSSTEYLLSMIQVHRRNELQEVNTARGLPQPKANLHFKKTRWRCIAYKMGCQWTFW